MEQPFFVSDSLKSRFELKDDPENGGFICEFEMGDIESVYHDIKEISFGENSYMSFVCEFFQIKDFFLKKIKNINILLDNQIVYSLCPTKIKNIIFSSNKENYIVLMSLK